MNILITAMILFLSFNKMLYFVRIYDKVNEMVIIIQSIIEQIGPFAIVSIVLLFAISKIYHVLHMGINDPQNLYASI